MFRWSQNFLHILYPRNQHLQFARSWSLDRVLHKPQGRSHAGLYLYVPFYGPPSKCRGLRMLFDPYLLDLTLERFPLRVARDFAYKSDFLGNFVVGKPLG
mgnify:CR=1 FL=1